MAPRPLRVRSPPLEPKPQGATGPRGRGGSPIRGWWLLAALAILAALAGCLGDGEADGEAVSPSDDAPQASEEPGGHDPSQGDEPSNGTGEDEASGSGNATEDGSPNGTDENETGSPEGSSGPPPGTVVAQGYIEVGSWTSSNFRSTASATDCDVQEVESFCFLDPPANVTVGTVTETDSPRYNLDIWFHSNDTGFLGGCDEGRTSPVGGAGDETGCTVPPEADWGTVDATFGANLTVEMVVEGGGG